jgi:hypothetical protein
VQKIIIALIVLVASIGFVSGNAIEDAFAQQGIVVTVQPVDNGYIISGETLNVASVMGSIIGNMAGVGKQVQVRLLDLNNGQDVYIVDVSPAQFKALVATVSDQDKFLSVYADIVATAVVEPKYGRPGGKFTGYVTPGGPGIGMVSQSVQPDWNNYDGGQAA